MNTANSPLGRDPVCEAIDALFHTMEADGHGRLRSLWTADSVTLSFGGFDADGPTYDIALVRLANLMMDDPRYRSLLIHTLREPMRASP